MNKLKGTRVAVAILSLLLIGCLFIDYNRKLPHFFDRVLELQLVPAILEGAALTVVLLLLFTFLFGRLYCAFICPSGILQDVFIRMSGLSGKKKKGRKQRRFLFHPANNILRYILLGITIILFLVGSTHLLSYLDPYSNFGRIVGNLLRPLVVFGNNALAAVLSSTGNYSLYHISIYNISIASFVAAILILLLFAVLSAWRGRLFCNTLCPVGGLLSVFSRFSLFRIDVDKEKCNSCGLCERNCKAECINSKSQIVDNSRCVTCFNCLSVCNRNALHYKPVTFSKKEKIPVEIEIKEEKTLTGKGPDSASRRSFFALTTTVVATAPFLSACIGKNKTKPALPVLPPGAGNLKRFTEKCTACHYCVVKCPSQIIKPAGFQFGFDYLLKPRLNYESGFCNYNCTICTDVCPNKALGSLSAEEKITTQLGIAHLARERCVVYTDETDCGACSEHCPTQAVKMVEYKGSLRIPHVTPDICVGCGGCEYICPVRPSRAIYVVANETHQIVKKPEYEKVREVEIDDFGF